MYNVAKAVVWNRDCWFENGCMYVPTSDDDVDNGDGDDDDNEEEEEQEQEDEDDDDDNDDKLTYNTTICNETCSEFIQHTSFLSDYSHPL